MQEILILSGLLGQVSVILLQRLPQLLFCYVLVVVFGSGGQQLLQLLFAALALRAQVRIYPNHVVKLGDLRLLHIFRDVYQFSWGILLVVFTDFQGFRLIL